MKLIDFKKNSIFRKKYRPIYEAISNDVMSRINIHAKIIDVDAHSMFGIIDVYAKRFPTTFVS